MTRPLLLLLGLAVVASACHDEEPTTLDTDTDTDTDTAPDPSDTDDTDTDTDTPPPVDPLDVDDDGDGFTENDGDCNDGNDAVNPAAAEECDNGVDDDCDTVIDDVAQSVLTWGPLPYLDAIDSPFIGLVSSDFVVEDFEDQLLPAGVTATEFRWSSSFSLTVVDSVDGDDGDPTNGLCNPCEAVWASSAVTFTFDPAVIGWSPTYVGVVLTDAFIADVTATLTATSTCATLGTLETSVTFGDGSIGGETAEDRFVGLYAPAGVAAMTISVGGAMEVDHLQFGR